MSDLAIVQRLMALGLKGKQLAGVIEIMAERDQQHEERKARDRLRKLRGRSVENPRTFHGHSAPVSAEIPLDNSPKEKSPLHPSKETTPSSSLRSEDKKSTAREALSTVLDPERAAAVVEHRAKLRKPLTLHAAKLLAGKFANCPDPNAAADAMISNGWQGFDPEWLNSNNHHRATRPNGLDSMLSAAADLMNELSQPELPNGQLKLIGK